MTGSHVAWIFVALLLGVGVGWLTYKRSRARLIDALIWIIVGLVIAVPILIPDLAAATTPLGTLVALFYFVGCPLGWTWRHGALVDHRCAETAAKGYVFRGAPTPSRWQTFGQQRATSATRSAAEEPNRTSVVTPLPPAAATAHAVPSDGKDMTRGVTAATGANAGVATAPASLVDAPAGETCLSTASLHGAQTAPASSALDEAPVAGVAATPSKGPAVVAPPAPTSHATLPEGATDASGANAPSPPPSPAATTGGSGGLATETDPSRSVATPAATATPSSGTTPDAPITSEPPPAPLHSEKPPVAEAVSSSDRPQSAPPVSASGLPAQTSLDLSPASPTGITSEKTEPAAAPAAALDPPASAPVPDQHKHAGVRPPGFVRAREDRPDDLQLIRGIGPQNEGRLHGLGIWHFDQIGAWTAEEVRWVGSYLAFPGRIDREKWVEQAREVAAGAIVPKAAARRPTRPR